MASKKRTPRGGTQGTLETQALSQALRNLLQQHQVTALRCAQDIGVAHSQLYGLTNGAANRNLTAVLALKLGRYFDRSPEELMMLQVRKELAVAMQVHGDEVQAIVPLKSGRVRVENTGMGEGA